MSLEPETEPPADPRVEDLLAAAFRMGFQQDPRITVSEWADRHRVLTRSTSSEHGRWRTARAPYLREPMDRMSPHDPTRRMVLMWGAQLGKTEIILNTIGHRIHLVPGPMMLVQPTVDVARNFSKERVVPLTIATDVVAQRVIENRSRDGENTIFVKRFLGGFLKMVGANSAAGLRSTPIRDLFADEIDGYPLDVDGEGDPVGLAEARTTNFPRGKKCYTSTPSLKGLSRVEKLFLRSDRRYYFVPCPRCGAMDTFHWGRLQYEKEDPGTAAMFCATCETLIEERFKTWMLERGEWRPTAIGDGILVGYHLNTLYSPLGWFSWADMAREWEQAQGNVVELKKFINTRLAETWEERSEGIDGEKLLERRETYAAEVPDGVGALVAAVDVQQDRLEWKVIGYGAGEESWLIAAASEPGDPSHDDVWLRLDEILRRKWTHVSGDELPLECVAIDSKYRTEQVYKFCKPRADRRVFAIRGGNQRGLPLVGRPTISYPFRARLYTLCTDSGKELVYARLRIAVPGPGYMHLPEWVNDEYLAQLTAEKAVRRFPRNRPSYVEWVKQRDRNEQLDLEVYCLAALRIRYGPQPYQALAAAAAKLSARAAAKASGPADEGSTPPPQSPPPAPPANNWVTGGGEWSV